MKTTMNLILYTMLIGVTLSLSGQDGKQMDKIDKEKKTEIATFAGGCFWCMEPPFDNTEGVISTRVGYSGGEVANPTYHDVTSGETGHAEAIEIIFDPEIVSYADLLQILWHNIDPTVKNRQFADRGTQYRTAIFYHSEEQKKAAELSREELEKSGKFENPIVTEIVHASEFYEAEEYHQDYYLKNSIHYKNYKIGSGRAGYLEETWGK